MASSILDAVLSAERECDSELEKARKTALDIADKAAAECRDILGAAEENAKRIRARGETEAKKKAEAILTEGERLAREKAAAITRDALPKTDAAANAVASLLLRIS